MRLDDHERARTLLDHDPIDGISPEDRRWLDAHLDHCPECGRHADLSARAVRALDSFAFELDRVAVLRVEDAVRSRAESMRAAESAARTLWAGTAVGILLTFGGSAITWHPAEWLASQWNLPTLAWQIAFAMFWLMPSLLLALLPLFLRQLMLEHPDDRGEPV